VTSRSGSYGDVRQFSQGTVAQEDAAERWEKQLSHMLSAFDGRVLSGIEQSLPSQTSPQPALYLTQFVQDGTPNPFPFSLASGNAAHEGSVNS
jgi:hypothetical protein